MAINPKLTKPYFNVISAFDATDGTTITLNVLGGSEITSFTYIIYNQSTNIQIYENTVHVVDNTTPDTRTIRTFDFTIPSTANLLNNTQYYIIAYTSNSLGDSYNSTPQLLYCYEQPLLDITISNEGIIGTYDAITGNYASLNVSFNKVDANSPALFQSATFSLYGIDSNGGSVLISQSGTIYDLSNSISLDGLAPTIDSEGTRLPTAPYSSYSIIAEGYTLEQTVLNTSITNLQCHYIVATDSSVFTAENLPSSGQIKLTYNYSYDLAFVLGGFTIQRQLAGNTNWITISQYEASNVTTDIEFVVYDNYNANNSLYTYRIVPYSNSTPSVIGTTNTATVLSCFYKSYMCDANTIYDISNEYSLDGIDYVQKSTLYEPYGSVYPFVGFNASTQYRSGNVQTLLLAKTSQSKIDRMAQVKLVNNFNTWLSNRRAKIIKDINGNIIIVAIINSLSNSYYKQLANGLASSQCSFVEVSDFTDANLQKVSMNNRAMVILSYPNDDGGNTLEISNAISYTDYNSAGGNSLILGGTTNNGL